MAHCHSRNTLQFVRHIWYHFLSLIISLLKREHIQGKKQKTFMCTCSYSLKLTEILHLSRDDTLKCTTSLSPSQMNQQEMKWISSVYLILLRQTWSGVSSNQCITWHFLSKFHCQSYLLSMKIRKLKSKLTGHCMYSSSALPNHVLTFKSIRSQFSWSFPVFP